jgi:peptide/nickel transport system substrate-binding protein
LTSLNNKSYKLVAIFICLAFVSPSFFVTGTRVNAQSSPPTTLSLGELYTPPISALNPFNPASEYTILGILYDYMFSLNWPPLPIVTPIMAGGYSMNANGTQYVISLRPDLKWDNGSPLNATDLWFTLNLYNQTGDFSPAITNMSILNSTSVQVDLASPNTQFILTGFIDNGIAVLPYQTFSQVSFANLSSFQNLNNIVADGPFVISNYTDQSPIVFQANPSYWNGPPKLNSLTYYFYTSPSSEFNAYVAGQIDALAYPGSYSGLESVANLSGHSFILPPYATPGLTVGAYLNDWVYPTNTTGFRRALAYATNVTLINEELNGPYANLTVSNQDFLLPSYNQEIGFGNGTGPVGYSYNVTEGKQLLQSIGFKYSGNTLEYPNGTSVSLTIKYRTTEPYSASVTTLLATEWEQLGITVNPLAVPSATLRANANNATGWQVIATGVLGPQTDNGVTPGPGILQDIGNYYVTMNGTNVSWNSTFYALTQQMLSEPQNSSQFYANARTAATMYVQGVPIVPLFNVYNWAAVSNSFYWGNPSNQTGVYYTQAITQLVYWDLSLDAVAPASSATSSTTGSTLTTTTNSISTSAVVTSSNSSASITASSSITSSASSGPTSSSLPSTSTTSSVTTASSTSTTSSSNTALYVGAAIVVIIIIIAGAVAMMRRGRKGQTGAASPPPPTTT